MIVFPAGLTKRNKMIQVGTKDYGWKIAGENCNCGGKSLLLLMVIIDRFRQ